MSEPRWKEIGDWSKVAGERCAMLILERTGLKDENTEG